MKKLIALLMALLLMFCFAACGSSENEKTEPENSNPVDTSSAVEEVKEKPTATPEPTAESEPETQLTVHENTFFTVGYNEEDGCVYFHCGKLGHRLDALKKHDKVSFCVYDQGYRREGEWAFNVKSVIIFGKIEIIDDLDRVIDITTKLSYKFTQDEEYIRKEIRVGAANTLLLKLVPDHMCGKLVNEA